MANRIELDVQREIVKSVKLEGGWSKKLTNRFTIGIPDLLIALYPSIPFLAEVKDLGVVHTNQFNRKLDVSEKQRYELLEFDRAVSEAHGRDIMWTGAKRYASVLLVGWSHQGTRWLAMLPPDAERIAVGVDAFDPVMVYRSPGKHNYPIRPLIELFVAIHKVNLL